MRAPFIIAVLLPLVIDHIVTLIGQPAGYWRDFSLANEASPWKLLLINHPGLFLGWLFIYVIIVWFLASKLPGKLVLPLGLLAYTGYAWGSSSWIPRILQMLDIQYPDPFHWYVTIGYFVVLSFVLAWGIWKWQARGFR